MAADPKFTATPRIGIAQISTTNTGRDGTGTLGSVLTGVAAGTRIDRVEIQATVTTTAGMVRLFIDDGTNIRMVREIPVSAITVSATVGGFNAIVDFPEGLVLPSASHVLKAGTEKAETFNVFAFGGDF